VTEPLAVRLNQLRVAASELHTVAVQLRSDVAVLATAADEVIDVDWRAAGGQKRAGRAAVTRLVAIIRDLDLASRALLDAAEAYAAVDGRSAYRARAVPW
jgi:hypothetical protein